MMFFWKPGRPGFNSPGVHFGKVTVSRELSILTGWREAEGWLLFILSGSLFPFSRFLTSMSLGRGGKSKLIEEAAPMRLHVDSALCAVWESEALVSGEHLVPSMSSKQDEACRY